MITASWRRLSLVGLSYMALVSAQCFLPNGTDRNARDGSQILYKTCNKPPAGSTQSMCCRTGDTCLASGLCQDNSGRFWRESCTDSTWTDLACIKLYIDDKGYRNPDSNWPISQDDVSLRLCDDGSWCLGSTNSACCDSKQGYILVNGKATLAAAGPSNSSSAAITTTSSTSTMTNTSPAQTFLSTPDSTTTSVASSADRGPNTVAAAVGVVVGIGGLALILVVLLVFLRRRRRLRKEKTPAPFERDGQAQYQTLVHEAKVSGHLPPPPQYQFRHELPHQSHPMELAVEPGELPTT